MSSRGCWENRDQTCQTQRPCEKQSITDKRDTLLTDSEWYAYEVTIRCMAKSQSLTVESEEADKSYGVVALPSHWRPQTRGKGLVPSVRRH
jgi:hypothetical protein